MTFNRRKAIAAIALSSGSLFLSEHGAAKVKNTKGNFRFCLNTSTISGQKTGLINYIEIATRAGYDGIEVWVSDVKDYLESGHSNASLRKHISDSGIKVENAIGFAPWLTEGETGFKQMEKEMEMLEAIGCNRIAAPPAGVSSDKPLDLYVAGEKYRKLIELGRQTGVMPQLEFWGSSKVLWNMGQILMIAAIADDPDVRVLPDVYHMFRGGSGFETLKMINGSILEIFHMNDYIDTIPREEQGDADRVYPGDGSAPLLEILSDLKNMGGDKVLSLELFNRDYWQKDPLSVAETGLSKMKTLVNDIR